MSQHNYIRVFVSGGDEWDIDALVAKDIETALPGEGFTVRCSGVNVTIGFIQPLSITDQTILDAVVAAYRSSAAQRALDLHKAAKVKSFDEKTSELIAGGFSYAGKQFSLTIASQSKMTAAYSTRLNASFAYPVQWNTIDDLDTHDLVDGAAIEAFYLTAVGTVRVHLDSGTVLKNMVRAATTITGVDAVQDSR